MHTYAVRGCGCTYCPVSWGTELALQPAHPVFHAACAILCLPSGKREPAQICAQANLGTGRNSVRRSEASQASSSSTCRTNVTTLQLQWYLHASPNSNMAAKHRYEAQIRSTNIPVCLLAVMFFSFYMNLMLFLENAIGHSNHTLPFASWN